MNSLLARSLLGISIKVFQLAHWRYRLVSTTLSFYCNFCLSLAPMLSFPVPEAADSSIQFADSVIKSRSEGQMTWKLRFRILRALLSCLWYYAFLAACLSLSRLEGLLYGSVSWSLDLWKSESDKELYRRRSFKNIFSNSGSREILTLQLWMWIITPSRFIEVALGDFMEEFEGKVTKYGHKQSVAWAQRQLLAETRDRLTRIAGLGNLIYAAWLWLKNHFNNH